MISQYCLYAGVSYIFKPLPSWRCGNNLRCVIFKHALLLDMLRIYHEMNVTVTRCSLDNIGSVNALLSPDSTKPLPELMLTQFYDVIWCLHEPSNCPVDMSEKLYILMHFR